MPDAIMVCLIWGSVEAMVLVDVEKVWVWVWDCSLASVSVCNRKPGPGEL